MFWTQELLKAINKDQPQLINDSKTPSGEPHIGSLRGVLIHDAIYKVLRDEGYNVRYTFGSDDYDPVDEMFLHLRVQNLVTWRIISFPVFSKFSILWEWRLKNTE